MNVIGNPSAPSAIKLPCIRKPKPILSFIFTTLPASIVRVTFIGTSIVSVIKYGLSSIVHNVSDVSLPDTSVYTVGSGVGVEVGVFSGRGGAAGTLGSRRRGRPVGGVQPALMGGA